MPKITLSDAYARGKTDIVFFARFFLGLDLHSGQQRINQEADGIVNVISTGNRFGKTAGIIAVRHIWRNFYKIGIPDGDQEAWRRAEYQTAALAPNGDVLEGDFTIIKQIMTSRFRVSREDEPLRTNQCRIEWFIELDKCHNSKGNYYIQFKDNSAIKFYSGSDDKFSKVQGQKFGYGSYDEAGRSLHLQYEIESNLLPRFQELGAPLDIVSTPDQRSPALLYHYQIFEMGVRGERGFKAFTGSAYENNFLPKHYFERIEEQMAGNPLRDQVIEGKFIFGGISYFMADDIAAAVDNKLTPGVPYKDGHTYVIGVDTAVGGTDEMVYTAIDTTYEPYQVVKQISCTGTKKSWQLHLDDFQNLVDEYRHGRNIKIIVETYNGIGAKFFQDLPRDLQAITKCWGSWQPEGMMPEAARAMKRISKPEIMIALRKVLSVRNIRLPNEPKLLEQLSLYREDDKNLKTDRVMSLAYAVWLATDGRSKNQTLQIINIEPF